MRQIRGKHLAWSPSSLLSSAALSHAEASPYISLVAITPLVAHSCLTHTIQSQRGMRLQSLEPCAGAPRFPGSVLPRSKKVGNSGRDGVRQLWPLFFRPADTAHEEVQSWLQRRTQENSFAQLVFCTSAGDPPKQSQLLSQKLGSVRRLRCTVENRFVGHPGIEGRFLCDRFAASILPGVLQASSALQR